MKYNPDNSTPTIPSNKETITRLQVLESVLGKDVLSFVNTHCSDKGVGGNLDNRRERTRAFFALILANKDSFERFRKNPLGYRIFVKTSNLTPVEKQKYAKDITSNQHGVECVQMTFWQLGNMDFDVISKIVQPQTIEAQIELTPQQIADNILAELNEKIADESGIRAIEDGEELAEILRKCTKSEIKAAEALNLLLKKEGVKIKFLWEDTKGHQFVSDVEGVKIPNNNSQKSWIKFRHLDKTLANELNGKLLLGDYLPEQDLRIELEEENLTTRRPKTPPPDSRIGQTTIRVPPDPTPPTTIGSTPTPKRRERFEPIFPIIPDIDNILGKNVQDYVPNLSESELSIHFNYVSADHGYLTGESLINFKIECMNLDSTNMLNMINEINLLYAEGRGNVNVGNISLYFAYQYSGLPSNKDFISEQEFLKKFAGSSEKFVLQYKIAKKLFFILSQMIAFNKRGDDLRPLLAMAGQLQEEVKLHDSGSLDRLLDQEKRILVRRFEKREITTEFKKHINSISIDINTTKFNIKLSDETFKAIEFALGGSGDKTDIRQEVIFYFINLEVKNEMLAEKLAKILVSWWDNARPKA